MAAEFLIRQKGNEDKSERIRERKSGSFDAFVSGREGRVIYGRRSRRNQWLNKKEGEKGWREEVTERKNEELVSFILPFHSLIRLTCDGAKGEREK